MTLANPTRSRYAITVMALLVLLACKSGGTTAPDGIPVIRAVTHVPATINPGDTVTFTAEVEGEVEGWNWSFTAGIPTDSTAEEPEIQFTLEGRWTALVYATNAEGTSTPYGFTVVVGDPPDDGDAPRIVRIDPQPLGVKEGQQATFTATIENGPITGWEWRFTGTDPLTSTEESPTVTFTQQGQRSGQLQVRNAVGESAIKTFQYSVIFPEPGLEILEITPPNPAGYSLQTVTFAATYNHPELVESPAWYFGIGATPKTANGLTPEVTLGTPGVYRVTHTVFGPSNGNGDSFSHDYTVLPQPGGVPPAITGLTPSPGEDLYGGTTVYIHAEADAPILSWAWTFAEGSVNETSTGQDGRVQVNSLRTIVRGEVQAANQFGSSMPFPFTYNIVPRPPTPNFATSVINSGVSWVHGAMPATVVHDNRLAVAYHDPSLGSLRYARALVAAPNGPGDWQLHTIDEGASVGRFASMTLQTGRPAVAYFDETNGDLKIARAQVSEPALTSDWTSYTLGTVGRSIGQYTSLITHNDRLAVSYYGRGTGGLWYARAQVAEPSDPSGWIGYALDRDGNAGLYNSLALLGGRPAISYHNETTHKPYLTVAESAEPSGILAWRRQELPFISGGYDGAYTTLLEVGGVPVVGCYLANSQRTLILIADSPTPLFPEDWSGGAITGGRYTSLALLDGRLALAASPGYALGQTVSGRLYLARELTRPLHTANWTSTSLGPTNEAPREPRVVALNGALATVWYEALSQELRVSVADSPW